MNCSDLVETVSAYLDGEATEEERVGVERHLTACAECAKRLESFRALKHAVARLEGRAAPPEGVQARVEALRFRPASLRERVGLSGAVAALAAAALAAFVVSGWRQSGVERPLSEELIADHRRSAPDVMPAEVVSADPAEVRRFFEAKVPFEPVVPTLGAAKLIGGRVCKIEGRKVQRLFYEINERMLSLYISDRPTKMEKCHKDGEHCVCGERRGRLSLMLVGRASEHELRELLNGAVL